MDIRVKRDYRAARRSDGALVLVDRLWPLGLSKERFRLDHWAKELAPSTELRHWFAHDPARWAEFRTRYANELNARPEEVKALLALAREGPVTLLYAAKDEELSNAVALKEYLERHAMRKKTMTQNVLRTPLCDMLGSSYPILQAGMGGVARSELAAAVCEAGAYGCLGMVREKPNLITREIAAVRQRTSRPFGVNLIPAATDPFLFDEELAACLEAKVHALVYFWDVVPQAVSKAKSAGCRVLYQVGSVEQAIAAEAAGADAVIVQGVEAGGHVHGHVTSLVLLPQVARALRVPVIGSGGFASGASLVAALALGAQGIHCGTAFIAADESFAHDIHKDKVIKATSRETVHTDAYAINWPPDSPVRVIVGPETERLGRNLWGHVGEDIPMEVIAEEEGRPIYLYSTDSPLRSMTGSLERLAFFAGQVAGQITRRESAADIVAAMVREATDILDRLERLRASGSQSATTSS